MICPLLLIWAAPITMNFVSQWVDNLVGSYPYVGQGLGVYPFLCHRD